jgi:AbiV family abortive infection protein
MNTFSLEECRNGIDKTVKNATRLRDDAQKNAEDGRHRAAALLGCFAFDEFGKAFIMAKLLLEAIHAGREHVTMQSLRAAGFFNHNAKLTFVFEVSTPFFTAFPPSPATDELVSKVKDAVFGLRNAIAYVGVDEQSFIGPEEIDIAQCQSALNQLSALQNFVDEHVLKYWEQKFAEHSLS